MALSAPKAKKKSTQNLEIEKRRSRQGLRNGTRARIRNEDGMLSIFLCDDFPLPAMFRYVVRVGLNWVGLAWLLGR